MEKATKNMTFQEMLQKFPKSADIIAAKGLHCLGCSGALFESVEQGSKMHGFTDKQIDDMLSEINSGNGKETKKAKKTSKAKK